ncbi:hypothetical protein BVI434_670010 [Burkholderia vietnamiensis]|nr:hypothetical protein BVI434_670010 [Burkholderia vietnamiensis]
MRLTCFSCGFHVRIPSKDMTKSWLNGTHLCRRKQPLICRVDLSQQTDSRAVSASVERILGDRNQSSIIPKLQSQCFP